MKFIVDRATAMIAVAKMFDLEFRVEHAYGVKNRIFIPMNGYEIEFDFDVEKVRLDLDIATDVANLETKVIVKDAKTGEIINERTVPAQEVQRP